MQGVCQIREIRENQGKGLCSKSVREKQGNWATARDNQQMLDTTNCLSLCLQLIDFLMCKKKLSKKHIKLKLELLFFIFRDGIRAYFAHIGKSLLK